MNNAELNTQYQRFLEGIQDAEASLVDARRVARNTHGMELRRRLWHGCLGLKLEILKPCHGPELVMAHADHLNDLLDAAREELG